jgi:hypothetical protein
VFDQEEGRLSKKLFGQVVLLIVIANVIYFAGLQFISWRAVQRSAQRMEEISQSAERRGAEAENASRLADELESGAAAISASNADTGENVIDGQVVHRVDGNWVNERGEVMRGSD